jgi:hypothetical protein
MNRLPLPTRAEANALFDQGKLNDEKPFEVIVTRAYQLEDLYMHESGSFPYIDAHFILGAHRFQWLELRTRAWTMRVELDTPGDERPRFRLYKLMWMEEGQKPLAETMAFDDLFICGVPIVGVQVLAILNRDDFLSLEYQVGRVHMRLQPKVLASQEGQQHVSEHAE